MQLDDWSSKSVARETHLFLVRFVPFPAAGPSEPGTLRREQDLCRPRSLYGHSKLAAEHALQNLAARLPVSVVRPPSVIGNWDMNLLQLYKMVRSGWNLVGISKLFQYSFVHAADLSQGILRAVGQGQRLRGVDDAESSGIYYLADPQPITMVELAEMVAASLGRPQLHHVRNPTAVVLGNGRRQRCVWPLLGNADVPEYRQNARSGCGIVGLRHPSGRAGTRILRRGTAGRHPHLPNDKLVPGTRLVKTPCGLET